MIGSRYANEMTGKQPLLAEAGPHRRDQADGQICFTSLKETASLVRELAQIDANRGSGNRQPPGQARHHGELGDVGGTQMKHPVRGGWIEVGAPIERHFQNIGGAIQVADEFGRIGCGRHTA